MWVRPALSGESGPDKWAPPRSGGQTGTGRHRGLGAGWLDGWMGGVAGGGGGRGRMNQMPAAYPRGWAPQRLGGNSGGRRGWWAGWMDGWTDGGGGREVVVLGGWVNQVLAACPGGWAPPRSGGNSGGGMAGWLDGWGVWRDGDGGRGRMNQMPAARWRVAQRQVQRGSEILAARRLRQPAAWAGTQERREVDVGCVTQGWGGVHVGPRGQRGPQAFRSRMRGRSRRSAERANMGAGARVWQPVCKRGRSGCACRRPLARAVGHSGGLRSDETCTRKTTSCRARLSGAC